MRMMRMMRRMKASPTGAALVVVLLMSLLLCIIATSFVNFQIMDRKMTHDEVNNLKAFMMADSGISYALCHLCRDMNWQGGAGGNPLHATQWVYQEGVYRYGFRVDCYYNAYDALCPYSYMYMVRSVGVVVDTTTNRCVSKRCVRAIIQCSNDYNWDHWNPTSMILEVSLLGLLTLSFSGFVLTTAVTAVTLSTLGIGDFEPNVRPDQCHFTYPTSNSTKAFLLRYYDENQ
jgi:hypothetical protein